MRILYVIDSLVPGGTERSLAAMAPSLVAAGVNLHVVPLLDRPGVQADLVAAGAELHPAVGAVRRPAVGALRRLIGRVSPDLVHTSLFEADVAGRVAARLVGTPVVTSLVGTGFPVPDGASPAMRARFAAAAAVDLATARLAVRFHAVSAEAADYGRRRLRVPADRIEVIHRGRDLDELGRRSAERRHGVRRTLGLDDGVPVVLAVARHDPRKGLEVLIAAWPAVASAVPGAVLLVAGRDGPASAALRRSIDDLGRPGEVTLLGHRDDVADLLAAADVLAFPSRAEGLPGTLLEALALELPIVAADIGPVREVLGAHHPVRLVPVGDAGALGAAVAASLRQPPPADLLAAGRALVERSFTVGASATRMAAFYHRSVSPRR